MLDPIRSDPSRPRLRPELAYVWSSLLKSRLARRRVEELSGWLVENGVAPGGEAAKLDLSELLRAFVTGRDEGIGFVFDPGQERIKEGIERWLDCPPGTLEAWLSDAVASGDSPGAPGAPPVRSPETGQQRAAPGESAAAGVDEQVFREARARGPTARLAKLLEVPEKEVDRRSPGDRAEVFSACRGLLQRLALDLVERDGGPLEQVLSPASAVERELASITGKPSITAKRRALLDLLTRFEEISADAGWLVHDAEIGWRFAGAELPALLVGEAIVEPEPRRAARLRDLVGREEGWADAAWAAVSLGDPVAAWARLLDEEGDPSRLRERAIITAAAFGGLSVVPPEPERLRMAFETALRALLAFFPRRTYDRTRHATEEDEGSPWYLAPGSLACSTWDLAHASRILKDALWPWDPAAIARSREGSLGRLCDVLGLPARLSDDEARAVVALCAPLPSARSGELDERFFRVLFDRNNRVLRALDERYTEAWMDVHGVSAIRAVDTERAPLLLAVPGAAHPAGFLLNRPSLVPHWFEAWKELDGTASAGVVVGAWADAAVRVLGHHPPDAAARRMILTEAPARLRELGLWSQATEALRAQLEETGFASSPDDARVEMEAELLRLADFTGEQLGALVERWTEQPSLPWRSLLLAGAPHEAIARWCVTKLRAQADAPDAYRDGPVGVLTDGGEVIRTEAWQIAFQQAHQALAWLVEHGDAAAVRVLAEACLAPPGKEPRIDPKVGEWLRLTIPFSQVLWGRVVRRRAGRAVFFDWILADRWVGGVQFVEGTVPYGTVENLWQFIALHSFLMQARTSEGDAPAAGARGAPPFEPLGEDEAPRLLSAFERWLGGVWVFERDWPRVEKMFVEAGQPRPETFPVVFRPHADPWLNTNTHQLLVGATVLVGCAQGGADVDRPLARQLERSAELVAPPPSALLLGSAVLSVVQRSGRLGPASSAAASKPGVLAWMLRDDTQPFWDALLSCSKPEDILRAVIDIDPGNVGLGLLEALASRAPSLLSEVEMLPAFASPLLVRAAGGAIEPSSAFWARAFSEPPDEATVRTLEEQPSGKWTEELLAGSRTWNSERRETVLRRLAGFAASADVRSACLGALWTRGPRGTE